MSEKKEIAIYSCAWPLDKVVPKIVEKAYQSGKKILIMFDSQERLDHFDILLWTFAQSSFLPHGKLGEPNVHPIWLSLTPENINQSDILMIVGMVDNPAENNNYEKLIYVLEKNTYDENSLKKVGLNFKDQTLSWWIQSDQGAWEAGNLDYISSPPQQHALAS